MHDAIRVGHLSCVLGLVLDKPEIINDENQEGLRPLDTACRYGRDEILKFLLEKKASQRVGP